MNRRKAFWVAFSLTLSIVAVVFAFVMIKPSQDVHVQFRVPIDFSGFFVIEDIPSGVKIEIDKNGVASFVIPEDAVLQTPSSKFLEKWHTVSAEDYSGVQIPAPPFDVAGSKDRALRSCGARTPSNTGVRQHIYFVGDQAGVDWFRKSGIYIKTDELNDSYKKIAQK